MSIQYEGNELEESEASRKRRWLVVALLFLVTLGGSVAARLAAETNPNLAHGQIGDWTRKVDQKALSFDGRLDRGAVHVGGDGLVHMELIATGGEGPTIALTRRPTDVVVVLGRRDARVLADRSHGPHGPQLRPFAPLPAGLRTRADGEAARQEHGSQGGKTSDHAGHFLRCGSV